MYKIRNEAQLVLYLQLLFIVVLSLVLFIFFGYISSLSIFCGGLVSLIPNVYFYKKAFKYKGAQNAAKIINSFYQGQAAKYILNAVFFSIMLSISFIKPVELFIGYLSTQLAYWLLPFIRIVNTYE